jgi:formylglycine-generating enzyme required for sulfatase activity/predicted MPP superfamily phosphohydrolase
MAVTWLHVSDFHLSDKGPYSQEVILRSLVSSVKHFREEGQVPDLIFATGDIAQNGKAKEYESATKFFDDLLDAAGLNRDRLFIVPGNHDVDRSSGEFLARTISSEASADRFFSPDKQYPHLTLKFYAFSEWYNDYFKTIRSFPTNTTCGPAEIITIKNCRIAVLPLNSALFCIDDHDHGKLFIGRRCLDAAKKQLAAADLTIAMIHHPLDWLSLLEQSKIEATLEASVDLLLQGHFHHTAAEGIVSANSGYLKLAAGAAYQTRYYQNSAMYATFDGYQVTIFPIRYEDTPREIWTLDASVFPSPIPGRTNFTDPNSIFQIQSPSPSDKLHQPYRKRYQVTLKEELGYIRMLGMPGVESIMVNLNNDTFVPLRLFDSQGRVNLFSKESTLQDSDHILYPDEIMKRAFHDGRGRRMLLVIGDPGAGKTTLLKYYALCALEDYKRLGFSAPLNVFYLPLRDLARDKDGHYTDSLPANLAGWSGKHHLTIERQFFDEWLQSGTSLVLLDGLDAISNTDERVEVCQWIDHAWSGFSKAFFVVTSRATGYRKDEGIELAADYDRADVQDFTAEQQERFLRNWFTAAFLKEPCEKGVELATWLAKQRKEAEERTTTIVAHLNVEKNKGLRQLAAIPMILQIMAILWKEREYMPESRVELYDAALNYLLEFRDKRRGIKPLLSALHARKVLAPVSFWMQATLKKDEASRAEMHAEMQERLNMLTTSPTADAFCDYLVKRAGLLVETGGKVYLFRHKSFREYLAGVQLKEDGPYEHLNRLATHFGEDWWEEPLRFFIASVDADVFDAFMQQLFESPVTEEMTQKQQSLLQTLIEEAPLKKVDALCTKLLDPETTANRQRVILDCLKAIGKTAALDALQEFRAKKLAKNVDVANRAEEVIFAFGGHLGDYEFDVPGNLNPFSLRNPNEYNTEYILIPGGSYLYSETQKEEYVLELYVAKYPVTNRLYRSFINFLHEKDLEDNFSRLHSAFKAELYAIAKNKSWGGQFSDYLKSGQGDLAALFKSDYDEHRNFDGDDQPVVGVTWYAARAYCLWLSLIEQEDNLYRLPTEIEWEWVAGGRQGEPVQIVRTYPWPEEKDGLSSVFANYNGNIGATTPTGSYPEGTTPEGLYDVAGNVWEWMDSGHNDSDDTIRFLRGGSWSDQPDSLRSSSRNNGVPSDRSGVFGFRVVRFSHSLRSQGKFVEAEQQYRRALELKEHFNVARILNSLAELLHDQGKYSEAEKLYCRVLEIKEKALGTDHLSVSTCLSKLGGVLQDQGKYAEAEQMYRRALEITEKILGSKHIAVAKNLEKLARLLRVQGNYNDANLLYEKALVICEGVLPEVPVDLVTACLKGECVVSVGSGIGIRAGIPTLSGLVEGLLQEAVATGKMDAKIFERQMVALKNGEINAVADNVVSAFGTDNKALLDYYRHSSTSSMPLPQIYRLFPRIPFAAILTLSYDDLLEQVLAGGDYECGLTPIDSERLLELLALRKKPFLVKQYGDFKRPETLIFAPKDFQNLVYRNLAFARFMEGLFFSRTMLFIGMSLDSLTDYLSVFRFPADVPQSHFALVAVAGEGWEVKAEALKRRYNISVIPFHPTPGYTEVDIFLGELAQSVDSRKGAAVPSLLSPSGPKLKKVVLENIGPFPKLELDFDDNWKILLGDNGVGKTTILKAIAVAIVGSEARHSAAPLLRIGEPLGRIRLVTVDNSNGYLTEIQRVGSGVEIVSYSGRALEAEGWVAIGFPPLRATSWAPTQGPQGVSVKRPSADDLLPLVRGVPDTRMDDLKQWIVNTEALSRREGAPDIDRNRAKEVLKSFFDIVNQLTDQSIEQFEEVTPDFCVLVRTNDGQIPIESLSQGMTSLLSWVGILLQRLYEVHYDSNNVTDPTQEYALVLMDEIDAHMHPKWQQTLVAKLKKIFPNVQVIASTHSPLVVAGMPVSQIVRFERNEDGQVETVHIDDDMSIGRTDQVLTGDLFGLETTLALDEETEQLMDEYKSLLSTRKRNNEQDNRYFELHRALADRIPPTSETKLERRAHELALAVLMADFRPDNILQLKSTLLKKVKEVGESMRWSDLS